LHAGLKNLKIERTGKLVLRVYYSTKKIRVALSETSRIMRKIDKVEIEE
jgi:hypothetical protein